MKRVGVISDTHGYLDPRVAEIFSNVDLIIHAGDIGPPEILSRLEAIAPITAVRGNTDFGLPCPETEITTLADTKIVVHHIVTPGQEFQPIQATLIRERPRVVIFGHTHRQFRQELNSILYLNPGYAGRPRPGTDRSVAILTIQEGSSLDVDFKSLD